MGPSHGHHRALGDMSQGLYALCFFGTGVFSASELTTLISVFFFFSFEERGGGEAR